MNKNIKRLIKEAGISILYEYDGYDGHAAVANLADIEKLVELIIKDCVTICNDANGASYLNGIYAGRQIKQHFGVEE